MAAVRIVSVGCIMSLAAGFARFGWVADITWLLGSHHFRGLQMLWGCRVRTFGMGCSGTLAVVAQFLWVAEILWLIAHLLGGAFGSWLRSHEIYGRQRCRGCGRTR